MQHSSLPDVLPDAVSNTGDPQPDQSSDTASPHGPVCNVLDADHIDLDADRNMHYVDAGATCEDELDGNLNRWIRVSGNIVNLGVPGLYTIKYDCKNLAGVAAATCTREVHVQDLTCPTCELNLGPNRIEASFPYFDSGAVCKDTLDGQVSFIAESNVNVESTGTYFVTYRARDAAKNWNDGTPSASHPSGHVPMLGAVTCKGAKEYVRTVIVVDTLSPVIGLHSTTN